MTETPEIACMNCGWTGDGEELIDTEDNGFLCPECLTGDELMPYREYEEQWLKNDLEGCPEL